MTMSIERPITITDDDTIDCTGAFAWSYRYNATCFIGDELVIREVLLPFFSIEHRTQFNDAVALIAKHPLGSGLRVGKLHKLS